MKRRTQNQIRNIETHSRLRAFVGGPTRPGLRRRQQNTMKITFKLCLVFQSVLCATMLARAQGTAFTYQGRLNDNGAPANGKYDLTFSVYDAGSAGNLVSGPVTNTAVTVSDGLFTTSFDFGAGVFAGSLLWLEIGAQTNGGAGNFVLLSPRQELTPTPYAIFAASAATSITAASVAAGSVVPNQLSTPAAPTDNQVLSFSGGSLLWKDPGASGSVWSLNGADTYYNAGNVGIGTSTPTPGVKLEVNGSALLTPGGLGGNIQFGTPSAETGMTIIGTNRADVRFDGVTLKLLAGAGRTPPSVAGGIAISTNGSVGVGIIPNSGAGIRLDVNGQAILRTGGNGGGFVSFGSPNGETGMTISGNNRADLRFDGAVLKLVAGGAGGPPSSANGIAITTAGNVGVGTEAPLAKLDVRGTTRTSVLTITGGSDLAEPFATGMGGLPKGSVVIIDEEHPGRLKLSSRAYDTRVAGIVSGANGINPGISLQQEGALEGGQNVALSGRVYVLADATFGAIRPGNLLTTSSTPGHAMKAGHSSKAQGAVLGKAMSGLADGKGMVLVLVTLQ